MFKKMGVEVRVGLFALFCIFIIAYATVKLGDRDVVAGGGYKLTMTMESAIGIKTKTPVEIAGIQIGVVKKIELDEFNRAKVVLLIRNNVKLPEGTTAYVRTKGFMGETFIELRPGQQGGETIAKNTEIPYDGVTGDVNMLLTQFNDIAKDIKSVTGSLKGMVGSDDSSPVYRAVNNIDKFTAALQELTVSNEANLNKIIANLATLTGDLKGVVENRKADVEKTLANLSSITGKVDSGQGTIGKLVNDDATVQKLNGAVDNLSDALGSLKRLETEVGYHTEYLTGTHDFKQYVHLNLLPTPDKGFLFEFVSDPNPNPTRVTQTTQITAGGVASTVQTKTSTVDENKFRISAELAKKFYDFTLRGGIIESTGGIGLDYDKGPAGLHFSAFDFSTQYNQRPHLKLLGNVNITKSLYVVGGADDFINKNQPRDWFVGAGFRLVDDDIKSLLGLGAKSIR